MARVTREICKLCYHVNTVGFSVPNDVWRAVAEDSVSLVMCLGCFTRLADEKGVEWDKQIEFYPVSRITHLRGLE